MRLFLDEDLASGVLVQVLRRAAHDIERPQDLGLSGIPDAALMLHGIREGRVILTRNYGDFEALHLLIMHLGAHHPGILLIRRDDQRQRNMSPRDFVRALKNLSAAGVQLADQCFALNAWQ